MSKGGGGVAETSLEKAQADVAKGLVHRYESAWVPVENFFMNRVHNIPARVEKDVGKSEAETRAQFGGAEPALTSALANKGITAGGGKFTSALSGHTLNEASATGGGGAAARDVVQQHYVAGLRDIVAAGQGQRADALGSLSSEASNSAALAREEAKVSLASQTATGEAVGTGVGLMTGLRGVYGTPAPQPQAQQQLPSPLQPRP